MGCLQRIKFYFSAVTDLSEASINSLATLKHLREVRIHRDKHFDVFTRGRNLSVEQHIVPLLKACESVAWGFEDAESSQVDFLMQANQLRFNLLDGQRVPLSLWPSIFHLAPDASKYKQSGDARTQPKAMAQADAVYLLLRQRAVFELLDSSD